MAKNAVKNEEIVVKVAKKVAKVEIKEPPRIPVSKIEEKIEKKVDEPAAVAEAKAPVTNEERKEDNSQEALNIVSEPPA